MSKMLLRNPFIYIFSRHAKAQPDLGSLALTGGIGGRNGPFQMSVALDEACSPVQPCNLLLLVGWLCFPLFERHQWVEACIHKRHTDMSRNLRPRGPQSLFIFTINIQFQGYSVLTYIYIVKVVQSYRFSLSCLQQLEALGSMALHVCSWSQVGSTVTSGQNLGCTKCTSARESNKWGNPNLTITLLCSYALCCIHHNSNHSIAFEFAGGQSNHSLLCQDLVGYSPCFVRPELRLQQKGTVLPGDVSEGFQKGRLQEQSAAVFGMVF